MPKHKCSIDSNHYSYCLSCYENPPAADTTRTSATPVEGEARRKWSYDSDDSSATHTWEEPSIAADTDACNDDYKHENKRPTRGGEDEEDISNDDWLDGLVPPADIHPDVKEALYNLLFEVMDWTKPGKHPKKGGQFWHKREYWQRNQKWYPDDENNRVEMEQLIPVICKLVRDGRLWPEFKDMFMEAFSVLWSDGGGDDHIEKAWSAPDGLGLAYVFGEEPYDNVFKSVDGTKEKRVTIKLGQAYSVAGRALKESTHNIQSVHLLGRVTLRAGFLSADKPDFSGKGHQK